MFEHGDFLRDLLTSAPAGGGPSGDDLGAFVGRADELGRLAALPGSVRAVTLVGAAGVGKTRLAREYAKQRTADYPGGVQFVDLSGTRDVESLHRALSDALSPWIEASLEAGAGPARQCLLVLDSCDRLAGACAGAVLALTKACPEIRVLITSREDVGLAPAGVLPVRPLPITDTVRLFAARAAEARRPLTAADLSPATAICRLLDGNPLATGLAAARTDVLSPCQILDRLGRDPLGLLTAPRLGVRAQRSFAAALDAGHDQLDHAQRTLLRRLAVFAAPCGLDAVEEVCADGVLAREWICDLLSSLTAKSLITCDTSGSEATYAMQPLTCAYAARKLAEAGEAEAVQLQHARVYAALVRKQGRADADDAELLAVLDRATLPQSQNQNQSQTRVQNPDLARHALDIAVAMSAHWWRTGRFAEARDRLSALLAVGPDASDHCDARAARGFFAALLGEPASSADSLPLGLLALPSPQALACGDSGELTTRLATLAQSDQALRHGRLAAAEKIARDVLRQATDTSDVPLAVLAHRALADAVQQLGRLDEARGLVTRAVTDARATGSPLLIALCLETLGRLSAASGDMERAAAAFDAVLDLDAPGTDRIRAAARLGLCRVAADDADPYVTRRHADAAAQVARATGDDHLLAQCLTALARQAADDGDRDHARTLQHKTLEILARLGADLAAIDCLAALAADAAVRGALDLAARLLGAIHTFDASSGRVLPAPDAARTARLLTQLKGVMSAERFAAAWALGSTAPLALTIAHARSERGLRRRGNGWSGLTAAELEVARLVAEGLTNRETAERLCLSPRTIQAHLAHIYDKLGIRSRRDLARETARRAGRLGHGGPALEAAV